MVASLNCASEPAGLGKRFELKACFDNTMFIYQNPMQAHGLNVGHEDGRTVVLIIGWMILACLFWGPRGMLMIENAGDALASTHAQIVHNLKVQLVCVCGSQETGAAARHAPFHAAHGRQAACLLVGLNSRAPGTKFCGIFPHKALPFAFFCPTCPIPIGMVKQCFLHAL